MNKALQLEGQRFGRLLVLKRNGSTSKGDSLWKCQCDCGRVTNVDANSLRAGRTKSCGCLRKDMMRDSHMIHGQSCHRNNQKTHPIYNTWMGMKGRCFNPSNNAYNRYGGRGITVCDEWKNSFESFQMWSINHGWKEGLSLDRIDNCKGYSPDNCRWTTMKVQNNNKRNLRLITYNGKTQTLTAWANELGMDKSLLYYRVTHWTVEEALTKEVHHHGNSV